MYLLYVYQLHLRIFDGEILKIGCPMQTVLIKIIACEFRFQYLRIPLSFLWILEKCLSSRCILICCRSCQFILIPLNSNKLLYAQQFFGISRNSSKNQGNRSNFACTCVILKKSDLFSRLSQSEMKQNKKQIIFENACNFFKICISSSVNYFRSSC